MTTTAAHSVTIYGTTYTLEVGSRVNVEARGPYNTETLLPSEWERAEFYLPCHSGPITEVAVNVRVTGRTFQRRPFSDALHVKVELEFVGDGEPSTFAPGWWLACN
jgi:hypothetical protein